VLSLDPSTQAVALRRSIGSQLQESALPDRAKVWKIVDLFASLKGATWEHLLDDWKLSDKRDARFS
jgi:ABC-2 type transport system ATP-binding protein